MLDFDCPRCHAAVSEELYGPCEPCRVQLRATMRRDARAMATEAYEPKMNVVPNQVASKDE